MRLLATCFKFMLSSGATALDWRPAPDTRDINRFFGTLVSDAQFYNTSGALSTSGVGFNCTSHAGTVNGQFGAAGSGGGTTSAALLLKLKKEMLAGTGFGWAIENGLSVNTGSPTVTPTDNQVWAKSFLGGIEYQVRAKASGTTITGLEIYDATTPAVLASSTFASPVSIAASTPRSLYPFRVWFSSAGITAEFSGNVCTYTGAITWTIDQDPELIAGIVGARSGNMTPSLASVHICDASGTAANVMPPLIATPTAKLALTGDANSGWTAGSATPLTTLVDSSDSLAIRAAAPGETVDCSMPDSPAKAAGVTDNVVAMNVVAFGVKRTNYVGSIAVRMKSGADEQSQTISGIDATARRFFARYNHKSDGSNYSLADYNAAEIRLTST